MVVFETKSGRLFVDREDGLYSMDFPAWEYREIEVTERVSQALGARPAELYMGKRDMMAVFETEAEVRGLCPDFRLVAQLDGLGLICTSPSQDYDFVSRFFVSELSIPEDPVTGSAHTMLVPFWAERLGKDVLTAYQASARGGLLECENLGGGRVRISGYAVTYMTGTIHL